MILPTIHLNGTPAERLLAQLVDAGTMLGRAIEALQESAPHARDYYPQGEKEWKQANTEHIDRLARLQSVLKELHEIADHIGGFTQ